MPILVRYHPGVRTSITVIMRTCAALGVVVTLDIMGVHAECLYPPPPCSELSSAQVVFSGEVLGVTDVQNSGLQQVRLRVLRAVKGVRPGVWSGAFSIAAEEHHFAVGSRVLVYGTQRQAHTWSTACGRTRAFDSSELALLTEELSQLKTCRSTAK